MAIARTQIGIVRRAYSLFEFIVRFWARARKSIAHYANSDIFVRLNSIPPSDKFDAYKRATVSCLYARNCLIYIYIKRNCRFADADRKTRAFLWVPGQVPEGSRSACVRDIEQTSRQNKTSGWAKEEDIDAASFASLWFSTVGRSQIGPRQTSKQVQRQP